MGERRFGVGSNPGKKCPSRYRTAAAKNKALARTDVIRESWE